MAVRGKFRRTMMMCPGRPWMQGPVKLLGELSSHSAMSTGKSCKTPHRVPTVPSPHERCRQCTDFCSTLGGRSLLMETTQELVAALSTYLDAAGIEIKEVKEKLRKTLREKEILEAQLR
jgi:hypothetical protein